MIVKREQDPPFSPPENEARRPAKRRGFGAKGDHARLKVENEAQEEAQGEKLREKRHEKRHEKRWETPQGPIRIARLLSRAGVCSRRDAEKWIAAGRVCVAGRLLSSPAASFPADAEIRVDGVAVPPPPPLRLWAYCKRRGELTTRRDPAGRRTIFDALPADMPRLISVGRLDFQSEGLLLLTNDGGFAGDLMHPRSHLQRHYRVRLQGRLDAAAIRAIEAGVTVDGMHYRPARIRRRDGSPWLSITLFEGKNREIRRIAEHFGLRVQRLIRVGYGPVRLGDLRPGAVREIENPARLFAGAAETVDAHPRRTP